MSHRIASLLSSKKHGHLLLTSYSVYNVVTCVQWCAQGLLSAEGNGVAEEIYRQTFKSRRIFR